MQEEVVEDFWGFFENTLSLENLEKKEQIEPLPGEYQAIGQKKPVDYQPLFICKKCDTMRQYCDYVNIMESCAQHVVCRVCLREHIKAMLSANNAIIYCPFDAGVPEPEPLTESMITSCLQDMELKYYQIVIEKHKAEIQQAEEEKKQEEHRLMQEALVCQDHGRMHSLEHLDCTEYVQWFRRHGIGDVYIVKNLVEMTTQMQILTKDNALLKEAEDSLKIKIWLPDPSKQMKQEFKWLICDNTVGSGDQCRYRSFSDI